MARVGTYKLAIAVSPRASSAPSCLSLDRPTPGDPLAARLRHLRVDRGLVQPERRHSHCGMLSPVDYEAAHAARSPLDQPVRQTGKDPYLDMPSWLRHGALSDRGLILVRQVIGN